MSDLIERVPDPRDAEITRLQGEVAQLAERLRTMADVVAVYAMPPVEVVRQRDRFAQDQWNQISQICSELLEQALGADHDPA